MQEVIEPEIIAAEKEPGRPSARLKPRGRGASTLLLFGLLMDLANLIPHPAISIIAGGILAALSCFHLRITPRQWLWWMAAGAIYCALGGIIKFVPLGLFFMLVVLIAPKIKLPFSRKKT